MMNTTDAMHWIHEFRSIIWFLVFLAAFAVLMFSAWAFASYVDKKESNGSFAPDNRFNDDWD
ncbi:MAG: hypothetical protein UU88_C0007G0010 [Parcubacteria group bacterium GW2011_GWC1_42_11]|uniref:Uncharacterized protein n=1 Tax=Candidatus Nomurabacteria bacterium GW2011_GWC2_42_20 TaxID=1618756 RepID=A0A0G0ZFF4_9BACT|nr:MAG: hypothetical protein UU88_C0007G0010 [Parcubacteria group bacterium GW2011_GWC1_42_11]KKS47470.1 MAG: hypothetical protein UV12_C0007G0010 [Candidatus Nomurabacteria bacterium GW2011_GWC2_42_20]KKT09509.1 MAG: hypothetical protein UV86_C0006G0024 [Candidatus Nomurabacteria bacterium GW2011_GWB1_43_20]